MVNAIFSVEWGVYIERPGTKRRKSDLGMSKNEQANLESGFARPNVGRKKAHSSERKAGRKSGTVCQQREGKFQRGISRKY